MKDQAVKQFSAAVNTFIQEVVLDYDFETDIQNAFKGFDIRSHIEEEVNDYDFSDKIENEVEMAISDHDFDFKIAEEIQRVLNSPEVRRNIYALVNEAAREAVANTWVNKSRATLASELTKLKQLLVKGKDKVKGVFVKK